ncbi:hypothetical protein K443DRAFT_15746 [Laccaria amethystina LaAM-08-1]|uniref:Uncharacterized protein n=1 Tax=Laccaria amethystina LaAM-08-1 TaxID=1095629 RepID=A0A0C9WZQ7_9AGAR|nr:hypothetical protein K443DRAFT_15746 [Laccaria amethystina LaAM-08-1]
MVSDSAYSKKRKGKERAEDVEPNNLPQLRKSKRQAQESESRPQKPGGGAGPSNWHSYRNQRDPDGTIT